MNRRMQMMMAAAREREDQEPRPGSEYNTARSESNGAGMNYGVEGRFRGDEQRDPDLREMRGGYEVENRGRRRDGRGRFRGEMEMRGGGEGGEMLAAYSGGEHMASAYEMRDNFPRMHKIGFSGQEEPMKKGHGQGKRLKLTEDMAEEWMENLCNADESEGPRWSREKVRRMMEDYHARGDLLEYYVVLNSLYADYCEVFRRYGISERPAFYLDMAKAFIEDEDAVDEKVAEYYAHIVK